MQQIIAQHNSLIINAFFSIKSVFSFAYCFFYNTFAPLLIIKFLFAMKKNYLWSYSLVALFLLFTACNTSEEDDVIPTSNKVNIEPDFFENDGSIEESDVEEEAPTGIDKKTYGYYNYTLLKPSELSQEKIDNMCGEATTMSLLVGSKKKKVGEVKVTNDEENLYLTFTADQHKYMKKVYLNIGAKGSTPFYSNGFPNLRKFNYKAFPYYFGGTKNATYVIPMSDVDMECLEIVAYAKVYDSYSRCLYTSFAYDESLTQTYSYSYYSRCYYYNEWVRSFEYCKKDCEVEKECVDAKGLFYKPLSLCFSEGGFSDWGWTNLIKFIILEEYQNNNGKNWQMPLYVNEEGEQCTEEDKIQIGYIELNVFYDADNNNLPSLSAEYVVTDSSYELSEVSFYFGFDKYPTDSEGNFTTSPEYYTYKIDSLDGNNFKLPTIAFDKEKLGAYSYFIPHAKVCKTAI